ncbi:MAG: aldolase/citrate lyase family protein [Gemmataceae bacterium]|nr:aldolase/citrate lyase family protein [Gemmataceae bacterium]
MRRNSVKERLRAGQPVVGTWLSLGSIVAARFLARAGFDYLTIDVEHTLVGMETTTHMIAAIADAGCVPLVRVPAGRHDHIKRALDNGAFGIVVPMVNTPDQAREATQACRYPPRGNRSVGGSVHALNFATTPAEYYAAADDQILCVLQCEHIQAVQQFDQIFGQPEVDAVFVGPNDLAASLRDKVGQPPSPEQLQQALHDILQGCKRLGLPAGIHTFSIEEARQRIAEGWQLIAINSELRFMMDGARQAATALGRLPTAESARY